MIKELVVFPDNRINIACGDVRTFNEGLQEVLTNMQDTMEHHNLDALSAIQIAIPYNIILIKQDGVYKEYINTRIIQSKGNIDSLESTAYYPNITHTIPRYEMIKVVYENKNGKSQYLDIEELWLSTTLQRKIDYTYGGTFLDRLPQKEQDNILDTLKSGGLVQQEEICPTFSKKDYFVSITNKLLFFMALFLLSPLANFSEETLSTLLSLSKFFFGAIVVLMIGFFFYAQYEAKRYTTCTSCQIGNNIGVIVKRVGLALILLLTAIYLL